MRHTRSSGHIIEKELYRNKYSLNIHWAELYENASAIHLISVYDKIYKILQQPIIIDFYFSKLCLNNSFEAIQMIKQELLINPNSSKINWYNLSKNISAIDILEHNIDKLNWSNLCTNINAIHIIEKHKDKIDWLKLCANPSAMLLINQELLKPNNNIYWNQLCRNQNAIPIITQELNNNWYSDKIDWYLLSLNPSAISLLEKEYFHKPKQLCRLNIDNIMVNKKAINIIIDIVRTKQTTKCWNVSSNECIFYTKYDYATIKQTKKDINKELIEYVYNPCRFNTN